MEREGDKARNKSEDLPDIVFRSFRVKSDRCTFLPITLPGVQSDLLPASYHLFILIVLQ